MWTEQGIVGRVATLSTRSNSERFLKQTGRPMPEQFDPYYTWLGIPPNEQPADFYRLLGIKRFEDNRDVISNAADQRMAHVRAFQSGPSARESQRVLNDLSKAAGCLLNPRRKAMYDQHLQSSGVTTRNEEALLPPQPNPTSNGGIQVVGIHAGVKRPARLHPSRPLHKVGFVVVGAILLVVIGLGGMWLWPKGASTTANGSSVAQANPLVAPPTAVASEVKTETTPKQPVTAVANRPAAAPPSEPAPKTNLPPSPSEPDKENTKGTPSSSVDTPAASSPAVPSRSDATPPLPSSTATGATSTEPAPPEIPAGRPKVLHFRGNDRVELDNTRGLFDLRQPFTVEMWIRFAPESVAHWITGDLIIGPNHSEVPSNMVAGWQLFIQQTQNARHRVAFSTREGYSSDFPVTANAWHHIAACGDTRQLTVYVDGRRSATGGIERLQTSFTPSPIPIHIGAHGYMHTNQPPGFTGDLRAFRMSSKCRYSANFEPAAVMAKDADTLVLCDFLNSTGNRLLDASGHGRDGAISGAQWIELENPTASALASTTIVPAPSVTTSPPTGTSPTGTSPTGTSPTGTSSAPVIEAVHPIPPETALIQAREQVRKVLKDEFENAKNPKEQLDLADKLMRLAAESQDELAGRFVMHEEAHKLAVQAGDLPKALAMIDDFARRFEVDAPKLKAAAVTKSADAVKTNADRRKLAEIAIGLLDELVMAGKFDAAGEVAQSAVTAASRAKDGDLGKTAREYRDEIAQAKKRWNEARQAEVKLADDPRNGELNLRWGRFVCFYQRNWAQGLPHLAIGDMPKLAAAAKQDLANPTKPDEQSSVGQAWSDLVKSVESGERPAVALRALHWLRQAESQLKGLAKADIEKQVKELEASLPARLRVAANKPLQPSGSAAPQPPREFLGALGRIQVNGVDAGVLWKYYAGLRLTNQSVFDILNQVNVPRGKIRMEFAGILYAHESMTVNIGHTGGSATATASVFVDNKPLGEVGGMRATNDVYKVELNAGEHAIRWVISGSDLGTCTLAFTNAATGQQLSVYHNQPLLNLVRETPTRARLNVNMTRN